MANVLTPEQQLIASQKRDEWTKISQCCDPVNFAEARHWASQCYIVANLTPPENWEFLLSPYAGHKYVLQHGYEANWAFSGMDCSWLAKYDTYKAFGADIPRMEPLLQLGRVAGWVGFYDKLCIIQDRPQEIHINEDGRLHNESGPAVAYRDGWAMYVIGGVVVDEQIVMSPESQPIEFILEEPNEEIKRIRIERFGHERFFKTIGVKEIDRRVNDIENGTREQLLRCNDDTMLFLRTFCPSTGRIYTLEILDTSVTTCAAAQSWLWNLQGMESETAIVGRT